MARVEKEARGLETLSVITLVSSKTLFVLSIVFRKLP